MELWPTGWCVSLAKVRGTKLQTFFTLATLSRNYFIDLEYMKQRKENEGTQQKQGPKIQWTNEPSRAIEPSSRANDTHDLFVAKTQIWANQLRISSQNLIILLHQTKLSQLHKRSMAIDEFGIVKTLQKELS